MFECVTPYVNALSVVVEDVGSTTRAGTAFLKGRGERSSGIGYPAIVFAIALLSRLLTVAGPFEPSCPNSTLLL